MRRVLVTGGSMGIGLAVAQALATEGNELVARRSRHRRPRAGCRFARRQRPLVARLRRQRRGRLEAPSELDELHGLVCAAAVMDPIGPIGEYAPADFKRTLEINVMGTLLAVHHCLPALRAGGGSIVTFGGGGATGPLPRFDAYAASKAAVARLSENLATTVARSRSTASPPGSSRRACTTQRSTAGAEVVGPEFFERTRRAVEAGGLSGIGGSGARLAPPERACRSRAS